MESTLLVFCVCGTGQPADSWQLNSIDDMRVDGKFYVGNDIPEGQGRVNDLLAECYDIVWQLRAAVAEVQQENMSEATEEAS